MPSCPYNKLLVLQDWSSSSGTLLLHSSHTQLAIFLLEDARHAPASKPFHLVFLMLSSRCYMAWSLTCLKYLFKCHLIWEAFPESSCSKVCVTQRCARTHTHTKSVPIPSSVLSIIPIITNVTKSIAYLLFLGIQALWCLGFLFLFCSLS